jgi:hypothetical protein
MITLDNEKDYIQNEGNVYKLFIDELEVASRFSDDPKQAVESLKQTYKAVKDYKIEVVIGEMENIIDYFKGVK